MWTAQRDTADEEMLRRRLRDRLHAALSADRARLKLAAGLGASLAVVAALQVSPVWAALRAALASLDFDPQRTALLAAWIGCALAALLAGALTRRPWPSIIAATALLLLSYALPWAWQAVHSRPVLFGRAEQLSVVGLLAELAVVAGVGFVAAVPAAAGGQLIAATAAGMLPERAAAGGGPARPAVSAVLVGALVLGVAALAVGAAPLIRYGPDHGLYRPLTASGVIAPAGQLLVRSFHSQAMGEDRPYAIYLPPSYGRDSRRRFPVVYLLHGDPGSYRDWLNLGITRLLDAGIASGSLPPLIAVMPDGNGKVNAASQWADAWDGRDQVEDSVLELAAVVDRQYRTLPGPRHRVVAGLSEGGFGAANLASRHPDLFGVAVSLSGYFTAQGPVFGSNPAYQRANSPAAVVGVSAAARRVYYFLAVGRQDTRYRNDAQAFARELDRLAVRHQLVLLSGGHDGGVWTTGLVLALEQVRAQLEDRGP